MCFRSGCQVSPCSTIGTFPPRCSAYILQTYSSIIWPRVAALDPVPPGGDSFILVLHIENRLPFQHPTRSCGSAEFTMMLAQSVAPSPFVRSSSHCSLVISGINSPRCVVPEKVSTRRGCVNKPHLKVDK